jgi:hypothetical protein
MAQTLLALFFKHHQRTGLKAAGVLRPQEGAIDIAAEAAGKEGIAGRIHSA